MIGMYAHINGVPIDIVNAQNIESLDIDPIDGKCLYAVTSLGRTFEVTHFRKDGWEKLFIKILKKLAEED